jgi:hypothetical protein
MQKPYCPGTNCPLKGSCNRYKPNIDVKKEIHFSEVPYDPSEEKCTYLLKQGRKIIYPSTSKTLKMAIQINFPDLNWGDFFYLKADDDQFKHELVGIL